MERATRRSTRALILAVAAVALFGPADGSQAALITVSSPSSLSLAIPDDGYTGALTPLSVASSSITLSAPVIDNTISDVAVTVALDHSFVGDLTMHLQAPDGTIITFVNRPGLAGNPDDGTGVGGDSSNLSALFAITFSDSAPSGLTAEQMGLGLSSSEVIGQSSPDNYIPFPDGAHGNLLFAGLNGHGATGTWTLFIGDSAAGATGSLSSWSITVTTIPSPGSLAILSLAGLAVSGRRRA